MDMETQDVSLGRIGGDEDVLNASDTESVISVASSTASGPGRRKRKKNQTKNRSISNSDLSLTELRLLQKDGAKLPAELRSRKQPLEKLLNRDYIQEEILVCLLEVLVTISQNDCEDVREVFRYLAKSNFIEVHILLYALNLRLGSPLIKSSDKIYQLILVLQAFPNYEPKSLENVRLVSAVVHDTARFTPSSMSDAKQLKSLHAAREILSRSSSAKVATKITDFRDMPIFPNGGEVMDADLPLLPKLNIGHQHSVDQFLSVHYRILREEIVQPLRDVISRYHSIKRTKGVNAAQKECGVYTGVRFHKVITDSISNGLTFRLQFDVSRLGNISWATTKKLSLKTMLCLTQNHFHKMVFAMVVERDPQNLQHGFVDVRVFQEDDILSLLSGTSFFMIDSNMFIEESYKVLCALKQISKDSMPFAKHIVFQCGEDEQPVYVQENPAVVYDVSPLVIDENSQRLTQRTWRAPLLKHDEWPSAPCVNVDNDQLKAIQAALSKSLTVITGASGTGKTFVGIKLVHLFLVNKHHWNKFTSSSLDNSMGGPIVFVCSTRATLDEYLVKIQNFQRTGIVRVGGPPTRRSLQACDLENHRRKHPVMKDKQGHKDSLERCAKRLLNVSVNIDMMGKVIVPEQVLKVVIDGVHYQSLTGGQCTSGNVLILEWLLKGVINEDKLGRLKTICNRDSCFTHDGTGVDSEWIEEKLPCALDPETSQIAFKARETISNLLRYEDRMERGETKMVTDVWKLGQHDRWRLYRHWTREFEIRAVEKGKSLCAEVELISRRQDEVDAEIFRAASVIGMTASCAAQYNQVLQNVNAQVVIIEEASDMLQSTTATILSMGCQQLVLIGDSQDKVNKFQAGKDFAVRSGIDVSLVKHLIKKDYSVFKLQTQHRMSPTTSKISRYLLKEEYSYHPSVMQLSGVKGLANNVFFIEHNDNKFPGSTEATFLEALFNFLVDKGIARNQISMITSYPAQYRYFNGRNSDRLFAVDYFRGENDIILYMCANSQHESRAGCLLREQRIMSVLTSARKGLYIIGNFTFLVKELQLWRQILTIARRLGWVDHHLKLTCANHPQTTTTVSTAEELEEYRTKQGCGHPCQARLQCGHSCKEVCHNHDEEQIAVICRQPCHKEICENGHKCKKLCSEPCETRCKDKVEKKLPCGHMQLLPCYLPTKHATCRDRCTRLLGCGHKCTGLCQAPCNQQCTQLTKKSNWPCGHIVEVRCCDGPECCPEPCNVPLACEHPCSGTCGKCRRGRLHVACDRYCGRTLVCGHACESSCSEQCPPCSKRCENRCQHSSCRNFCGEACMPCRESCLWQCPHISCPKLCGEPCEREQCNEPCLKALTCGHTCIGMCGEKCPTKCRICDKEEVTEIFFGNEDDDDARFVELEDCGHVIEVDALDQYMNMSQDSEDDVNIQLKGCPRCKTPIRRNLRYGNIIKRALMDVETVKAKMRGDQQEIKQKMDELKGKMAQIRRHSAYYDEFVDEGDLMLLLEGMTRMRHLEKVISRLNRCSFLRAIADIRSKPLNVLCEFSLSNRREKVWKRLDELKDAVLAEPLDRFTEQQMNDLQREITRVSLEMEVLTILCRNIPSLHHILKCEPLNALDSLIGKETQFTKDDERRAIDFLLQTKARSGNAVLGVSDDERIEIVKAIGLSKGHWFKCPNGHVYAIGDCGGAMERAKCPECSADIGGESHRLTKENSLATEMDGATSASWPTGNDMEEQYYAVNFNQEEIEEQFEILRQIEDVRERNRRERDDRERREQEGERVIAEQWPLQRELERARRQRLERAQEQARVQELERAEEMARQQARRQRVELEQERRRTQLMELDQEALREEIRRGLQGPHGNSNKNCTIS